mmetsp:Transcript_25683/g.71862  ORF Transcript_25683/g.71862 Transcript_25683/m.71862 type:complete len:317 (+) Transcript_25683:1933-2883(+)
MPLPVVHIARRNRAVPVAHARRERTVSVIHIARREGAIPVIHIARRKRAFPVVDATRERTISVIRARRERAFPVSHTREGGGPVVDARRERAVPVTRARRERAVLVSNARREGAVPVIRARRDQRAVPVVQPCSPFFHPWKRGPIPVVRPGKRRAVPAIIQPRRGRAVIHPGRGPPAAPGGRSPETLPLVVLVFAVIFHRTGSIYLSGVLVLGRKSFGGAAVLAAPPPLGIASVSAAVCRSAGGRRAVVVSHRSSGIPVGQRRGRRRPRLILAAVPLRDFDAAAQAPGADPPAVKSIAPSISITQISGSPGGARPR